MNSVSSLCRPARRRACVAVWRLPFLPDHSRSKVRGFVAYGSFTLAAALFAPVRGAEPGPVWVYNAPFTTGAAALCFAMRAGSRSRLCARILAGELRGRGGVAAAANPSVDVRVLAVDQSHSAPARGDDARDADGVMRRRYPALAARFAPLWWTGVASPPRAGCSAARARCAFRLMYAGNSGPAQALDVGSTGRDCSKGDGSR
jgi:hypothetical protein